MLQPPPHKIRPPIAESLAGASTRKISGNAPRPGCPSSPSQGVYSIHFGTLHTENQDFRNLFWRRGVDHIEASPKSQHPHITLKPEQTLNIRRDAFELHGTRPHRVSQQPGSEGARPEGLFYLLRGAHAQSRWCRRWKFDLQHARPRPRQVPRATSDLCIS